MPKFSVIVPVYNRPQEVKELLDSLTNQDFKDFEVLIVEDGSTDTCKAGVDSFADTLNVQYFFKENSGQGFSRNYGFERAKGDWLIVFDSDCLIPPHYFTAVNSYLENHSVDAFGGPDRAHTDFTVIQKAISYSMTSLFTTGGIRGGKKYIGTFHPRSFNMGIRKEVFERTGGYILPKKGEDIEFSIRIIANGFKTALIEEAYVFHKRRTNFRQFYNQLHFFGTARINVFRFFPGELKVVHLFPSMFFLGFITSMLLSALGWIIGFVGVFFYVAYSLILFFDSLVKTKSFSVAVLSVIASYIQLFAYGIGLMKEGMIYLIKG
ncbi:MAG: glycosyltransferase [Ekhidna sp.]